jgi:hypothetical protein
MHCSEVDETATGSANFLVLCQAVVCAGVAIGTSRTSAIQAWAA